MSEQTTQRTRKKEGRSPGYPAISLGSALERAKTIMEKEQRHYAALPTIFGHWGYGSKSSMGILLLAALKKYGLVEYKGSGDSRQARITDFAWRILVDDRPESPEREELIREAALNPSIHQKLWRHYDGLLPSDENLRHQLLTEEGFTTGAVDDFIRQFRATIEFAGLKESDSLSGHEQDKSAIREENVMAQTTQTTTGGAQTGVHLGGGPPAVDRLNVPAGQAQMGNIAFPLSPTKWVHIQLPYGLTKKEWSQILKKLDVFKDGFMDPAELEEDDN